MILWWKDEKMKKQTFWKFRNKLFWIAGFKVIAVLQQGHWKETVCRSSNCWDTETWRPRRFTLGFSLKVKTYTEPADVRLLASLPARNSYLPVCMPVRTGWKRCCMYTGIDLCKIFRYLTEIVSHCPVSMVEVATQSHQSRISSWNETGRYRLVHGVSFFFSLRYETQKQMSQEKRFSKAVWQWLTHFLNILFYTGYFLRYISYRPPRRFGS
jgi:hypothetical protein